PSLRLTRDAMTGFPQIRTGGGQAARSGGPLGFVASRIGSPEPRLDASRRPWTFVECSSAQADQEPMGSTRETQRVRVRTPGRGVMLVQAAALVIVTGVALLTVDDANWNVSRLLVLATLTIISGLTSIEVGGSSRIRISGFALGLMLAVALLGG